MTEFLRNEDAKRSPSRRSISAVVPRAIAPVAGSCVEVELGQPPQQVAPSNSSAAAPRVRSYTR
jgi:hypothetical protein